MADPSSLGPRCGVGPGGAQTYTVALGAGNRYRRGPTPRLDSGEGFARTSFFSAFSFCSDGSVGQATHAKADNKRREAMESETTSQRPEAAFNSMKVKSASHAQPLRKRHMNYGWLAASRKVRK